MPRPTRIVTLVLVLFVTWSTRALRAQMFLSTTPGLPTQTAQEAAFLAAVNGHVAAIDFEDANLAVGAIPGQPWASLGFAIQQRNSSPAVLQATNTTVAAHSGTRFAVGSYPAQESIGLSFNPPRTAVGFWIIDSEVNTGGGDRVRFLDPSGAVLWDVPMPVNGATTIELGAQGNLFIGLVSATPIAAVEMIESNTDGDAVGVDDVIFGGGTPRFPGPGDALLLRTGVGFASPSAVPFDVKTASAGSVLTLTMTSSQPGYWFRPMILAIDLFPTGLPMPSFPGFPTLYLGAASAVVLTPFTPLGLPILPAGGASVALAIPAGFAGTSISCQGIVFTPLAANGFAAASDAHRIDIQ